MADEKVSFLAEAWPVVRDLILPLLPPAFGAYVGVSFSKDLTRNQIFAVGIAALVTGLYIGGGIAEYYQLGYKVAGGIMFAISMVSQELFASVTATFGEYRKDPSGTFLRWRNALFGRKE